MRNGGRLVDRREMIGGVLELGGIGGMGIRECELEAGGKGFLGELDSGELDGEVAVLMGGGVRGGVVDLMDEVDGLGHESILDSDLEVSDELYEDEDLYSAL